MMGDVEVVDLFSGGGGFTEGAVLAGAKVVLSIDCWEPAIRIHKANHPNIPCINYTLGGSIKETAALIRSRLTSGAHFHLHGSPPCQKLSNASSDDSEEGMVLVNWFIDLVRYMNPDSWSMENVLPVAKKIDSHRPNTPYVKLNSADFGVPQTRNRIFAGEGWVANPTHTKEEWVSVIEALPHLEGELNMTTNKNIKQRSVEEPMRTITSKTPSQTRIVSRRRKAGEEPQAYNPSRPAHTITQVTHILEYKLEALGANQKRHQDRTISKPSKTICGSGNQVGARIFEHDDIKAVKIRSLTLAETAVLQGFSADMQIPYKRKKDAWTVLGNAVCPAVAAAIIKGVQ